MSNNFQILDESTDFISYLPIFLRETREFNILADIINSELTRLKEAVNRVAREMFIQYAIDTLTWREEEYGIMASSDETITFRRERLIERNSRKPPITRRSLEERINRYIGTDSARVNLVPGEYAFTVSLPAIDAYKFRDIFDLIERLKPANMEYLQQPFSIERVRIREVSREVKIIYARAGLALAGLTPVGEVAADRVIYQR